MAHHMASVLTTLSSSPVTLHTNLYHVTLFLLIHGLCQATGAKIYNCNNNEVEIFEDSPAPVTCGDIINTQNVVWTRGGRITIGECTTDGTCTTNLYNDYRLSRSPQSTESQLTLVPDYRRHASHRVTCWDRTSGSIAYCTLIIKHHSVLSECHVTNNTVDWTVSGSCRVQQAFSSDNIYTCTWTRNHGEAFGGFDASRELCSFTQALPQAGGLYTYSISVSPPGNTTFSQQLTLVEPVDIRTSCPHWVVSGRDLSCTCQTTNTASPPATVRWEGRDSEKLVKTNVQREDNGTQFTCHVTWAGRVVTSITYTLMVEVLEIVVVVSSSTDFTHVIIGVVVAVGGIAVIAAVTVMLIRKRRCRLQKSPADLVQLPLGSSQIVTHLPADDSRPANDHSYTNLCITEVSATAQPQGATEGKDQTDMYEDTQTLTVRTYDTTCRQHEEHKYSDLQVMTSQGHSKVKATAPDPRDGEGKNKDMYYNVS